MQPSGDLKTEKQRKDKQTNMSSSCIQETKYHLQHLVFSVQYTCFFFIMIWYMREEIFFFIFWKWGESLQETEPAL